MPQIAPPDDQLDSFRYQPGVTPNEVTQAEHWAQAENVRRRNFGLDWARRAEVRNGEVSTATGRELRDLTRQADDVVARAESGDYESLDDLFNELDNLRRAFIHHERAISALAITEQTIAEVKEDGATYFHEFFERYPALADRVPSLADELTRYRTQRR